MKKMKYFIFAMAMFLIPTIVFAKSLDDFNSSDFIMMAIFFTLFEFASIYWGLKRNKGTQKPIPLLIRILIINILGYIIFKSIWIVLGIISIYLIDIIVYICSQSSSKPKAVFKTSNVSTCPNCNFILNSNDKFCGNCGFDLNKPMITKPIDGNTFDPMYNKSEDDIIKDIIIEECDSLGLSLTSKLIPVKEKRRFTILNILLSVLVFIFMFLIVYHLPIYVYIIGILVLVLLYVKTRKIDLIKYITKEVKARPNENIDNIIGSIKESLVSNNLIITSIVCPLVAVILSLVAFYKPIIIYEDISGGCAVRFYIAGWSSLTKAEIPAKHDDKSVVSLRGNTFSNMFLLKEVSLPDTITEIRGEAFKNDILLEKVHIPTSLTYLGGESFYGCKKLVSVDFTYETPLEEIKGDTFYNCKSLKEITIPDSVTRIASHAFYQNYSLENVNISENSKLNEIGSSAFRVCISLKSITIPNSVFVNSKAFKESPTVVNRMDDILNDDLNLEDFKKHDTFDLKLNDSKKIDISASSKFKISYAYAGINNDIFYMSLSGPISEYLSFGVEGYVYKNEKCIIVFNSDSSGSTITVDIYYN